MVQAVEKVTDGLSGNGGMAKTPLLLSHHLEPGGHHQRRSRCPLEPVLGSAEI